jgi:three-Cys-motif partner protein
MNAPGCPEEYKGREQTYIKHTLLKTYLERLFLIIGQHEKVICYVDCFAGPWQEDSDKLKDTSISISLEIMQKCHDSLQKMGKEVRFRALYIEKEKQAFNKLELFLKEHSFNGVEAHALNGEFINLRSDILRWCGDKDFTFFFIDPKGWKRAVEIPTLSPLLVRSHSEFLINFMYDFLLRTHTQEAFSEDIKAIFGEVPDTKGMLPKEKERLLVRKYRDNLKYAQQDNVVKPRSACVAVLHPVKERTKYHLVYLTRHPLGIKVFMEESEKVSLFQKQVRAHTQQEQRIKRTGQCEMFSGIAIKGSTNDQIDIDEVKKYWLSKLSLTPKSFGIIELADMLEETDWFVMDFQNAFRELESEDRVKNLDRQKKRPVHTVKFKDNERLVRIK